MFSWQSLVIDIDRWHSTDIGPPMESTRSWISLFQYAIARAAKPDHNPTFYCSWMSRLLLCTLWSFAYGNPLPYSRLDWTGLEWTGLDWNGLYLFQRRVIGVTNYAKLASYQASPPTWSAHSWPRLAIHWKTGKGRLGGGGAGAPPCTMQVTLNLLLSYKRLCTTYYLDPKCISAFLACYLIALDKA